MLARLRTAPVTRGLTSLGRYSYVGKKHLERVRYDDDSCREFDLLLKKADVSSDATSRATDNRVSRMFLGCLFSRIIGSNFPNSIYLSQEVKYLRDVGKGEEVVGKVEVVKDLGRSRYEIRTECLSVEGEKVMEGRALILQE
jgi:hypothetical protein